MTLLLLSAQASSVPGVYFEEIGYGACAHVADGGDTLQLPYFTNFNEADDTFSDISDDECATLCGEHDECLGYFEVFGMCFLYHAHGNAFENLASFDAGNQEHLGTDVTGIDVTFSTLPQPNGGICYKKMITHCDDPIGSSTFITGYVWDEENFSVSDCTSQTDGCANPTVTGVNCASGYAAPSGISVTQCTDDDLSTQFTGCQFVEWETGSWSLCSSITNNNGVKFRSVTCSTGNDEDCDGALDSKPSHVTGCSTSQVQFHWNSNGGRCTVNSNPSNPYELRHQRCVYDYQDAHTECHDRCLYNPWCKGYAITVDRCELATDGDCDDATPNTGAIGQPLLLTGGDSGLSSWELTQDWSGCYVKTLNNAQMDIFDNDWQRENLLLTKPDPMTTNEWLSPLVNDNQVFWFSTYNADFFFDYNNWASFDWEITFNKYEDNRIVIRVRDETSVLIHELSSGVTPVEVLQSSSGYGVHQHDALGDWQNNDIITNPARLCRLDGVSGGNVHPGFDISNAELYHCYAEEGGCDDYTIEGEIVCQPGYIQTGEIAVQQCTDLDALVTLSGCEPVVCVLPESQEGYKFQSGASISGCDTVNGCNDMVISGVICENDYAVPEGAVLSALPCTPETDEVELTGCSTIVEVHMCSAVDADHAPAICETISEELGSTNLVDCVFGEACDDGTRRFLQSGISIITKASVPNAEEAIAIVEHPDFLDNIDWESAGLGDLEVSLVAAMQQPTAAPTSNPTVEPNTEVQTVTVVETRSETDFIIMGLLGLIILALSFQLCWRNSPPVQSKLLDVEDAMKSRSVSIVCADVSGKRSPKSPSLVTLAVALESQTPTE